MFLCTVPWLCFYNIMIAASPGDETTDIEGGIESAQCMEDPAELHKNITMLRNRRGAIRHANLHEVNGHRYRARFFRQFTFCAFCKEFLW